MRRLQEQLPDLAEELGEVEERIEDLLPVVRNYVYHPGTASFSIKSVAPVLVPELSYDELEIAGGRGGESAAVPGCCCGVSGMKKSEIRKLRGESDEVLRDGYGGVGGGAQGTAETRCGDVITSLCPSCFPD